MIESRCLPRYILHANHFCSALLLSSLSLAAAQNPSERPPAQSGLITVYRVGDRVTAPEVVPTRFTTADCDAPLSGEIDIATIVDISGVPRNMVFVHPLGSHLDRLALATLAAERFKPGELNGVPVPVTESVSVKLEACPVHAQSGSGADATYLRVHSQPELRFAATDIYPAEVEYGSDLSNNGGLFHVGPDVTAPVRLLGSNTIEVGSGKKAKYQGDVILTLIVDANGMPLNVRVARPLGMGLDQKAIDEMRQARFRPAMFKRKRPVPVDITVLVNFRLY